MRGAPRKEGSRYGVSFAFDVFLRRVSAAAAEERKYFCLLYTSDAADDLLCVDLGGDCNSMSFGNYCCKSAAEFQQQPPIMTHHAVLGAEGTRRHRNTSTVCSVVISQGVAIV